MPKKNHSHHSKVHEEESRTVSDKETVEAPSSDMPADPLAALLKERDELKDSYLRLAADMDNYRKRIQKEKDDYHKYAVKSLVEKLLPVMDNFGRCLQAEGDAEALKQGVGMILSQLEGVLGEAGLQKIELSAGDEFNPQRAEALMMEENTDAPFSLTVAEVFEVGWCIGDQVIRTAKVKVYKK